MVSEPGMRAVVLARCLGDLPSGMAAGLVAEEVASALVEARDAASAPPLDAQLARLPGVVLANGDPGVRRASWPVWSRISSRRARRRGCMVPRCCMLRSGRGARGA